MPSAENVRKDLSSSQSSSPNRTYLPKPSPAASSKSRAKTSIQKTKIPKHLKSPPTNAFYNPHPYSHILSPSPYTIVHPRHSLSTTHPLFIPQPAAILQPHPSTYAILQPYPVAQNTMFQYPNPLPNQPLTATASTLAAAIGRSSSTPGLLESSGKVCLEDMELPPSLPPLMPRQDPSHEHFARRHRQQRTASNSPPLSPTSR